MSLPTRFEFHALKQQLWDSFYREKTGNRINILVGECWPFVFFLVGIWSYSILIPYGARILAVFEMAAHAQTPRTLTWASGKAEWVFTLAAVSHLVLLAILILCVCHLLFAKKSNTWAGKIAMYLLGFLTKALAGFMPNIQAIG